MSTVRRIVRVTGDLRAEFAAIRDQVGVPSDFPAEVLAEAEAAARKRDGAAPQLPDETAIPFVTIDPPGSRDLDQAVHIERRANGGGWRVRYAIADVAAWVAPLGAIDREAHARGVTVYSPDGRAPLHPPALSEGAASLLPGQECPALVWTVELDGDGVAERSHVARARVRSRAQLDYAGVQRDGGELAGLLAEVGQARERVERARGGVRLPVPEQEVVADGEGWTVSYRAELPVEGYNAQISLLCGMEAARMMLDAGLGVLRTMPEPDPKRVEELRLSAAALDAPWPAEQSYPEWLRSLDPEKPAHAALVHEAAGLSRSAGYTAFDGKAPEQPGHAAIAAPYAHVTAPLRRLADRFALEVCACTCAGAEVPGWVREGLPALPVAMAAGDRRARAVERAIVDLVEAAQLAGRVGELLPAVVVDVGNGKPLVQLRDPAVRTRAEGDGASAGDEVAVRVAAAEPEQRKVRLVIERG